MPDYFRFSFVQVVTEPCGSVVLSWRHRGHVTETWDFQLQMTQLLKVSCLFSFKSILLRTSGKCQCIKRTVCMLNFIYIVQCKWYLWLKISVQRPFNNFTLKCLLQSMDMHKIDHTFHFLSFLLICKVIWRGWGGCTNLFKNQRYIYISEEYLFLAF